MIDQLIIGEKASFDDYEASLATRAIGMPTKKTIKETVPFSNVTYNFSKINGELYWEERELEYGFEIIAPTPEKLEELKAAFASWVMNVFEEDIHDPFIPDHHFVGTFADIDFEDEETLDKTTVTVIFTAYPYKISDLPVVVEFTGGSGEQSITLISRSSHTVALTITWELLKDDNDIEPDAQIGTIFINDVSAKFVKNQKIDDGRFALKPGTTDVRIVVSNHGIANNYKITFGYYEEVF